MLHFWRAAMLSMLAVPDTISSSQARPRAMDLMSAVRRSAFIGRARDLAVEAGSRISLNLLAGGFVQGTLGEILKGRFHSVLLLACDGRLLQIELALDASARLVSNFALPQQPVDECTLGGNQLGSEFRDGGSSFEPI